MVELMNSKYEINSFKIHKSAQIIKQGGIVVFPTETVYGIGVNALDKEAVRKLYDIKNRDLSKPISLLVSNMTMINNLAKNITDLEYKLMEKFFPGPLTIILNKKDIVPDIVTANQKTVGIRMPSEKTAIDLVNCANVPIATTSANISGNPSRTNLKEVRKDFKGKVDYFINGGESKIGIASTIVKVIDNIPHILRKGPITKEQIKDISRHVIIDL